MPSSEFTMMSIRLENSSASAGPWLRVVWTAGNLTVHEGREFEVQAFLGSRHTGLQLRDTGSTRHTGGHKDHKAHRGCVHLRVRWAGTQPRFQRGAALNWGGKASTRSSATSSSTFALSTSRCSPTAGSNNCHSGVLLNVHPRGHRPTSFPHMQGAQ